MYAVLFAFPLAPSIFACLWNRRINFFTEALDNGFEHPKKKQILSLKSEKKLPAIRLDVEPYIRLTAAAVRIFMTKKV
jgi:hypothetical protein